MIERSIDHLPDLVMEINRTESIYLVLLSRTSRKIPHEEV
jgi:hypothetical protein